MHPFEKPKRKNTPQRPNWILRLIGVMVVVFCTYMFFIGAGWSWGNAYVACFGSFLPSEADVENSSFFKLPPSARNLEYDADYGGRSCSSVINFEIDSTDLEVFQRSTLVESLTSSGSENTSIPYFLKERDWTPSINSVTGSGRSQSYNPFEYQQVFVEMTDSNRFAVTIVIERDWL